MAQNTEGNIYLSIESANNSYDSRTKEFKRLYQSGRKTFIIELTNEEKTSIYGELEKSNFPILPSTYEAKGDEQIHTEPNFRYRLVSNFGGKHKEIFYSNEVTDSQVLKDVAPFMKLYRAVWEIIYSNEEVKGLQESNVFYE